MSNVIEFKPKKNHIDNNKSLSIKCKVLEFPNMTEYINLFEKYLNNDNSLSSILNALKYIDNQISKIVNDDVKIDEMSLAITNFVEYFQSKYENYNKLWDVLSKSKNIPISFQVASFIEEQKILNEGFSKFFDLDETIQKYIDNLCSFIFNKLQGERIISFVFNGDTENSNTIQLFPSKLEKHLEEKRAMFIAMIANMTENGGLIFVEEMKKNKKKPLSLKQNIICSDLYGFAYNSNGIFSIMPDELEDEFEHQEGRNYKIYDIEYD